VGTILLVDDEPGVLFTLQHVLANEGHRTITARSAAEALNRLEGVEAVLTDLRMPEMNGLDLLRTIHEKDGTLPIILVTAHGSEKVAVRAMKAGAYDYMTKPFDVDEVGLVVQRALEWRRLRIANRRLRAEHALGARLIAESPPMRKLLDAVERVAQRDVTVLIRGETGTGKELIAALLHAHSPRATKALVRFNCAAVPGELAGFFSEADGGTLVLDEIGDLQEGAQATLLQALQGGEIQPVGSARKGNVDVRLVATTQRDLHADATSGRFRQDLYYRLAVVELVVPPLRDRRSDIPALAREFARRYAEKFCLDDLRLSEGLIDRLLQSEWPGNVRQLENTIARLAALSRGGLIHASALDTTSSPTGSAPIEEVGNSVDGPSLRETVEAFERNLIVRALDAAKGNQSEAARRLCTSRVTLVDKIRKYGISR
jgi:two-component system response regulator AtoC